MIRVVIFRHCSTPSSAEKAVADFKMRLSLAGIQVPEFSQAKAKQKLKRGVSWLVLPFRHAWQRASIQRANNDTAHAMLGEVRVSWRLAQSAAITVAHRVQEVDPPNQLMS